MRKSSGYYTSECKLCNINKVKERAKVNSEKRLNYAKDYYKENKEVRVEYDKQRRLKNKDKIKEYNAKYHEEHKSEMNAKTRRYYENNKETLNKKQNVYKQKRRQDDPIFHMQHRVRSRLLKALQAKSWKKTTKFNDYIGCSLEELKAHIESKFVDDMSWDNRTLWHLDHLIPLSSANTEEEIYKLCHYTNLQPLWAIDNLVKSDKAIITNIL